MIYIYIYIYIYIDINKYDINVMNPNTRALHVLTSMKQN